MNPFWQSFLTGAVPGAIQGYRAGASGGMQPGLAGIAEATVDPNRVISRGERVRAIGMAEPAIKEIQTLAESGNIQQAQQRLIQVGAELLKAGVEPDLVQSIINDQGRMALTVGMGSYAQGASKGIDATTPEGQAALLQVQQRLNPLDVKGNISLGQAERRTRASETNAQNAAAIRALQLQNSQYFQNERLKQGAEGLDIRRQGLAIQEQNAANAPNKMEAAAEKEYRSIDTAVGRIASLVSEGKMAVPAANVQIGALNSRIARANQKYGRDMPTYFVTPEDGVKPVMRGDSGAGNLDVSGQPPAQGAIMRLPDGKFRLPTGEIVDNVETLKELFRKGLIPDWEVQ